jgi:hypothetical protein
MRLIASSRVKVGLRLYWSQFTEIFPGRRVATIAASRQRSGALDNSYLLSIIGSKQEDAMQAVHSGQCGLCNHFGEHHAKSSALVTILSSKKADAKLLDECGHPKHAALHLKVSPISGCDGFVPAAQA